MRIRKRLVGLLMCVLALGAAVAMFPSGSAAAGRGQEDTPVAQKPASQTMTCNDAKRFLADEMRLASRYFDSLTKERYETAVKRLVAAACDGILTCSDAQGVVAELRSIRAGLVPQDVETQLQALEDQVLQKVCSS